MTRRSSMTYAILFALGASLVVLGMPGLSQEPTAKSEGQTVAILLQADSTVDEAIVRLRHVAELRGGSAALRQAMAELDLAEVPANGRSVAITRGQVEIRLLLAGIEASAFSVAGPERIVVRPTAEELSEAAVFQAARKILMQRLPGPPESTLIKLVQPIVLPMREDTDKGAIRLIGELAPVRQPLGKVRVDVIVFVNGQRRCSIPVSVEVTCHQDVVLAKRRIDVGEMLHDACVTVERRPLENLENFLPAADIVNKKKARRVLLPGQLLGSIDVEDSEDANPVLVRARELVRLTAQIGGIRVVASGEALQEGRHGQVIRVRNIDSNKIVQGKVVERLVVEVDY